MGRGRKALAPCSSGQATKEDQVTKDNTVEVLALATICDLKGDERLAATAERIEAITQGKTLVEVLHVA